jgi:HlyD family secretion protein
MPRRRQLQPRTSRVHPRGRRSYRRLFMGLTLIVAGALTSSGCGAPGTARASQNAGAAPARVEVIRPQRGGISRSTDQPGQIEAYETTEIFARVSGYVEKWTVEIGDKVKKGQTLVVISVPELDAEAEQRQAMVEETQAKLAQARSMEEVAQSDLAGARARQAEEQAGIKRALADVARWQAEYHRIEQLVSQHAQTGSLLDETRSQFQSAESARDEAYAQITTAAAAVKQAQARVDKARADATAANASIKVARADLQHTQAARAYATITAPYDGLISRRNVMVGELTEPGSRGQPLFIVVRDDILRLVVSVPEMYAMAVDRGDRISVRLQAVDPGNIDARVARTSWVLDAKSRTLRVETDLKNPDGHLRPGLYANTTIFVTEHHDALLLPRSAIAGREAQPYCAIVADGKIVGRPVKLGLEDGIRVEILAGLKGDEAVVKAYAASLEQGQSVVVAEGK